MSKILKAAAAAALIASGATVVLAQGAQNPTGDQRPIAPGASEPTQPNDKKEQPTNATPSAPQATPGVGSRPIGPPAGAGETTTKPPGVDQKKSPN
jgi:hypothetical protein